MNFTVYAFPQQIDTYLSVNFNTGLRFMAFEAALTRRLGVQLSLLWVEKVTRPLLCIAPVSETLGLATSANTQCCKLVEPGRIASSSNPDITNLKTQETETRESWRSIQASHAWDAAASTSSAGRIAVINSARHSETQACTEGPDWPRDAPEGGDISSGEQLAGEMEEVFNILKDMGLQPGRRCLVGDGLAEVKVGLYLSGVKVALEMEATRPNCTSHTMASDTKAYALRRAAWRVLQAHGWHPIMLDATEWRQLDSEQKADYLAHCIKHALGMAHQQDHNHSHVSCGSGCGDSSHRH